MAEIKYNSKLLWHYYFKLGGFTYLHGRMFSKNQAERVRKIHNH